ncbi:helix-turn-helix transcriptional regulator [Microcella sp.]|uniref:helix-turn-helix transcriptional regulator n=1 Tax=Microcella sp. TaxID=1913979 RepID=UPI00256243AE|nr:WYL domain-containing protein [Microcella sp.]MBX9470745.1 WYL domain-containing protein [Microcella sp.]
MADEARKVPVEERLFSLVLALLATEQGLTKAEILSTVTGYAARYEQGGDHASLERQFERDKEDLRDLGVPLETVDERGAEGDTKLQRYRIPPSRYQLPDDLEFSAEEYALLTLAAQVWREGSLSTDSRRALTKLQSLGLRIDDNVIGFAPTIRTRDAAYEPLSAAIDRGQQVSFDYLKPGQPLAERRLVSPLALVYHEGRWHLHAHDDRADAARTFLLRRIVSVVESTSSPATHRPGADEPVHVLAELEALWQSTVATVAARPGSEADVVLRNRPGTTEADGRLVVHATDLDILADELAAFGADVRVVEPAAVRDAVRARWQSVVQAHG